MSSDRPEESENRDLLDFTPAKESSLGEVSTSVMEKGEWQKAVDIAVEESRRDGTPLAVIFIDVNDFKFINDEMGHLNGDELIADIRGMLSSVIRINPSAMR